MARYQYAKNEHGEIVKAVDLVGRGLCCTKIS